MKRNLYIYIAASFLIAATIIFHCSNISAQTITVCEDGMAGDYPCDGYDLYTVLPLGEIGGGDNGNDCWGWTDEESGREFVLFGRYSGLSVVEITDPLDPLFIATLPTATQNSLWRDVKVIGNYAFIVAEAGQHGMQVLELTQLLELTGFPFNISPTTVYLEFGNSHNIAVNEETNFAYAVGTNTFEGGLHIIDVSNPEMPLLAGSYDEYIIHDAQAIVYNGLDEDYVGKEIVFCFNGFNGIAIVNVENKNDVQLIKQISYENSYYTHQGWVSEDHRFVFFNDEWDETNTGNNTRTHIMNIEDLDNPVIIGYYEYDNIAIDHNLYVNNGRVYASNYLSGLRVSTILENGMLEPYGYFDTNPESDEPAFQGTWSNYPFFPSGSIAVSTFTHLFILRETGDPDGIDSPIVDNSTGLDIYPNPANSTVLLSGNHSNSDIIIYDMSGRESLRMNSLPSLDGLNVDISSLDEGMYIIKVIDASNRKELATSKLLISQD